MKIKSLLILVVTSVNLLAQQVNLVTHLNNSINETSGLITINQKLITHNDSGGEAALYEIDTTSGNYTRKVTVSNAYNQDWEDICSDSNYIYIADFGNNSGTRTNLKIYRILISDFINTPNDTVTADTINFNYADQTDFTPSTYSTNFDAEAIISIGDSLYIFTKNWGNYWTNIYALPKTPGSYQATKIDSINTQGLITGATYNKTNGAITLVGYTFTSPFIVKISQYSNHQFSNGIIAKTILSVPASIQTESISPISQNQYYLTAEEHSSGNSSLYRFIEQAVGISEIGLADNYIYPNPTSSQLHFKYSNLKLALIYNHSGVLVYQTKSKSIDLSGLKKGLYFVEVIHSQNNKSSFHKLLLN